MSAFWGYHPHWNWVLRGKADKQFVPEPQVKSDFREFSLWPLTHWVRNIDWLRNALDRALEKYPCSWHPPGASHVYFFNLLNLSKVKGQNRCMSSRTLWRSTMMTTDCRSVAANGGRLYEIRSDLTRWPSPSLRRAGQRQLYAHQWPATPYCSAVIM